MGATVCVTSQKGGVGKTTVALNLATALAEKGRRVLLVDLDPQGGVGLALARQDTALIGLAEVLLGQAPPEQAVLATRLAGLSLLPRGRLDPVDVCSFEQVLHQPGRLGALLAPLKGKFDYLVADTPSGLGLPTRAALATSDFVLVPVQAEALALRSIHQVLRVIEHVRANENPKLNLLGLLLTMLELKKEHSRNVAETLWGGFEAVLETTVPRAEVFQQASAKGLPLSLLGGPASPEARRFELLAAEVEQAISNWSNANGSEAQRLERQLF